MLSAEQSQLSKNVAELGLGFGTRSSVTIALCFSLKNGDGEQKIEEEKENEEAGVSPHLSEGMRRLSC